MLFLVLACADERGPRPAEDPVEYDGFVFAGPTDTEAVLDVGAVTFTPEGGEPIAATEPFTDVPGYWRVNLPAGVAYSLRIVGNTGYPAVWRGTAPENSASWFTGALFGADTTQVDTFLAALPTPANVTLGYLGDAQVAHLWGVPWTAEDWDCALVLVDEQAPLCYLQDTTTGAVTRVESGPMSFFLAPNLLPGEVVVDSGVGGTETYVVDGGEMIYAFWFSVTGQGAG